MRIQPFLLFMPLFALGACITTSEVGVYPHEEKDKAQTPELPPALGGDGGTEAGPLKGPDEDLHPLAPVRNRLAAGSLSTCVITSAGAVNCWGDNQHGQLGVGSSSLKATSYDSPVPGLDSNVDSIFGGALAHCALKRDGSVVCWGDTVFEQSEDGIYSHAINYSPRPVKGLSNVAAVAIGQFFQCALTTSKSTKCYGMNSRQAAPQRTSTGFEHPTDVTGMGNQGKTLAAAQSGYFACAATSAGALKCWGANDYGQLGNGSQNDAREPTQVVGLEAGVTAVAAGREHACAVVDSGVLCWGSNADGQLGDGSLNKDSSTPQRVPGLWGVTALTAGNGHTCALTRDHAVLCWGNYYEVNGPSGVPKLAMLRDVAEVAAGSYHTCALRTNGVLVCWGNGQNGQLGRFAYPEGDIP